MSAQHTPGPWTAVDPVDEPDVLCHEIVGPTSGHPLATVWTDYYAVAPIPEHEANARLIAAAPALLEALEGLLNEALGQGWYGPRLTAWSEAVQKAQEAVAAARGTAT